MEVLAAASTGADASFNARSRLLYATTAEEVDGRVLLCRVWNGWKRKR